MKVYFISDYVEKNAICLDDKTLSDSIKNIVQIISNAAYLAGASEKSIPIPVKCPYTPTSLFAAYNRNNFQYLFTYLDYCLAEFKRRHMKDHEFKTHLNKIKNLMADPNLNFSIRSKYKNVESLVPKSDSTYDSSFTNFFERELKKRFKNYKPNWTATTPPSKFNGYY